MQIVTTNIRMNSVPGSSRHPAAQVQASGSHVDMPVIAAFNARAVRLHFSILLDNHLRVADSSSGAC